MEKIFWIGGSKGGVGKSAVSMALLDYLGELCPLLVETDTANPDVAKAYGNVVRTELLDLDESDGWIELINLCAEHSGPVVINSAARSDVAKNGMNLDLADVHHLSVALDAFYSLNEASKLQSYSQTCLQRIWKAQRFSWWMTSLLHCFPEESPFDQKRQLAELAYVTGSRAAATSLAENYVGLPLDGAYAV